MEPAHSKKEDDPPTATIRLQRTHPIDPKTALGRSLFHAVGTRQIAFDGRACASCHPDGRDDGLTWATQEGPRRARISRLSRCRPQRSDPVRRLTCRRGAV